MLYKLLFSYFLSLLVFNSLSYAQSMTCHQLFSESSVNNTIFSQPIKIVPKLGIKDPKVFGLVNTKEKIEKGIENYSTMIADLNRQIHEANRTKSSNLFNLKRKYLEVLDLREIYFGETFKVSPSLYTKAADRINYYEPWYIDSAGDYHVLFSTSVDLMGAVVMSFWNISAVPVSERPSNKVLLKSFIDSLFESPENAHSAEPPSYTPTEVKTFTIFDKNFQPELSMQFIDYRQPYANMPFIFKRLFKENLKFISNEYARRGTVDKKLMSQLIKISEDLESRSALLVATKETWEDWEIYKRGGKKPENFTILATMTMVESHMPEQLLPVELFTGHRIKRLHPDEILIELSRHAVKSDESSITSAELFYAASAIASKTPDLGRIIIEADATRARLFKRYGFEIIGETKRPSGSVDFIMSVEPKFFLQQANKHFPQN